MNRIWNHIAVLLLVTVVLCVSGCGSGTHSDISVGRFEQVLLETPEASLRSELARFRKEYPTHLLRIDPDDESFMAMVKEFRSDAVAHEVYDTVQRYYADLSWLESDLSKALSKAHDLDAEIVYNKFVTFITNEGYAMRVRADRESRSVTIAIDEYVTQRMRPYGYFGEPLYIVRQCGAEHIVPDCMAEIVRQHIALPSQEMSLLDYMVAEGKVIYFLKKVLPKTDDTILFRYTKEQMQWMEANEANVWAYFVHNQLLYERDFGRLHNFVDEAPKTNAFHESAPRTHSYLGWHIVSKYAKKQSKMTLKELLEETDSQRILQESGYRP